MTDFRLKNRCLFLLLTFPQRQQDNESSQTIAEVVSSVDLRLNLAAAELHQRRLETLEGTCIHQASDTRWWDASARGEVAGLGLTGMAGRSLCD